MYEKEEIFTASIVLPDTYITWNTKTGNISHFNNKTSMENKIAHADTLTEFLDWIDTQEDAYMGIEDIEIFNQLTGNK
jgi:hypothetical protein